MGNDDTAKDRYYKAAVELYKDEHRRWNQWALFFFGALASTFVAWNTALKELGIPLWVPSSIAAIISFLWTLSAQAIRRSSKTWQETIVEVEKYNAPPFTFHTKKRQQFPHGHDLIETLMLQEMWSISRNLVRLGIVAMFTFLALATWDCLRHGDDWLKIWAIFTTFLSVVSIVWAIGATLKLRKIKSAEPGEQ